MNRSTWTHGFEQPGYKVDLNVVISQRTDELERLFVSIPGERHDHAVDVLSFDDLDDLIRLAEELHIRQVAAHLFRGSHRQSRAG